MDGFFWDSFITRREIVYSKLHFICHTWKVYLSPSNSELRVNLFDSPSLISSTYHWFIDAKRHWKCNAVILMMPYFVEHNAVKIIFFSVKSQISSALTLDSKHKALQLTCKRKFICVSLNVLFLYWITHVRGKDGNWTEKQDRHSRTPGICGNRKYWNEEYYHSCMFAFHWLVFSCRVTTR